MDAPLLDDWDHFYSGINSGGGADFFRDLDTLLGRVQLRDELGDLSTDFLGLHVTLLHGGIHHQGLHLVSTDPGTLDINYQKVPLLDHNIAYLYKGTVSRGTEHSRLLPALRLGLAVGHRPVIH